MSRFFGTLLLRLRFLDFVVLFLTVAITVFCTVKIYGKNEAALHIVIQGKNESWVYPVNQSVQVDVPGPLGHTTVELKDGKTRVISSPCTNQTCVTSGTVQRRGQWVACLPNAVFVRIESANRKYKNHAEPAYSTESDYYKRSGEGASLDAVVW